MLKQLQTIFATNLSRNQSLPDIPIRVSSDTQDGETKPTTLCGWVPTLLEPPGPLSLVLWKTNPEYRAATLPVRRTILREAILKLHERVDKELKGHGWSRKRVQEQLAAQLSADISPPQNTRELNEALAYLYEIQLVLVDEANKTVAWVPEDPRTWTPSRPVWGLTLGARAALHAPNEGSVGNLLSTWLSARDQEGWKIRWPVADGTLEEIRASLTEMGAGLGAAARMEKPKKADYAAAAGRAQTIRHFARHFSAAAPLIETEVAGPGA